MRTRNNMLRMLIIFLFCANSMFAQNKSLSSFISAAKENSPLLKDYTNQVNLLRIDSAILKRSFGPQVEFKSNDYYAPVINGWGYDEIATNIDLFNALLSVSLEITGRQTKQNLFDQNQLQQMSLTNISKISARELEKTITDQFINAYASQGTWQFNEELLQLLKEEQKIFQQLTENSVYKQTDYLSFLVAVQQQEFLVSQNEMDYQNELATLNYLCGINDTGLYHLDAPGIQKSALPSFGNTLIQQQFVLDSLLLHNMDKQIDLGYKPKLELFTDGGYTTTFQLDAYKNFGISAGLNLSIPIYDGGQRKLQHQKIELQQQTVDDYRNFAATRYSQQVDQLNNQLQMNAQLRSQLSTQLKTMETLLDANKKLLANGDIQLADYLIMLNNYRTMKNQSIDIDTTNYRLINQMNYLNTSE